jgi:hypothetical protein
MDHQPNPLQLRPHWIRLLMLIYLGSEESIQARVWAFHAPHQNHTKKKPQPDKVRSHLKKTSPFSTPLLDA